MPTSHKRPTRWTLVINDHRAWVFERRGDRGRMSTVFSLANPNAKATPASHVGPAHGPALADRAVTGWATTLGEHMRLASSAGRYDALELIAPEPIASTVERAAHDHVDLVADETIEAADDAEVRREAGRITRRLAAAN